MNSFKGLLVATAIALMTTAYGQTAEAHVREVKVYRGTAAVELVPVVGQKARQRSKVLKGEATEKMAPIPASLSAEGTGYPSLTGGDKLWLVDQNAGEIVGCRLSKHLLWDLGNRIRCTRGNLPR